ncbi:MAG: hypothetical protein JOS17DRAFT_776978 [Linnemannia elongata]|nr:MAG: hypothetical protein JOS17DRAFT_776978 [Linnemannia elongata]
MVITKPNKAVPAKRRGRPPKSCLPTAAFKPIEYQRPIIPSTQPNNTKIKHRPGHPSGQPRSVVLKVAASKKTSEKTNVDRVDASTSARSKGSKELARGPIDPSAAVTKKSDKKKSDELTERLYLAISKTQAADRNRRELGTAGRDFDIQDRDRRSSTSGSSITSSRSIGGSFNFLALGPSSSRRGSSTSVATDANEEEEREDEKVVKKMKRQPMLNELEAMGYSNSLDDKPQQYTPLEFGKGDFLLPIFNGIESTCDWQHQRQQHFQCQSEEMSMASCFSSSPSSSLSSSSPLSPFSSMSLDALDVLDVPMLLPTVCYDDLSIVPPTFDALAVAEAEAAMNNGLDLIYLMQNFPFFPSLPLASPLPTPTTTTTAASYFQLFDHNDASHDLSFLSMDPLTVGLESILPFIQADTSTQCSIADPFASLMPMPMPMAIGLSKPSDPSVQFEAVSAYTPIPESRKNSKYYLDLVAEKLASNSSLPSPSPSEH